MKTRFWLACSTALAVGTGLLAQNANVVVPPKVLESYVGQYELMPGFVLTVRKEGDHLSAQPTGQPKVRLSATSETDFRVAAVDASVTFVKNSEGKVTQLVLHQNGDHEAAKISSTVPKDRLAIKLLPSAYDQYIGKYELAPEQVLTVQRDGDKLRAQLTGQPSFQIFPESETEFFYKVVDAQITFVKGQDGKLKELVLHQNGDKTAPRIATEAPPFKGPDLTKIPKRDPATPPQLLDLTGKYTATLTEQWHPDVNGLPEGGNHLAALPRGLQKLGDTQFDIRGLIQLTGSQAEFAGAVFPDAQTGIKVGRKCKRLHFLHGAGWSAEDGTIIGKYILHYAGGESATLNVIYGSDVRDWWASGDQSAELKSAKVAWSGSNPAAAATSASIRLYQRTYENPKPELQIETMDFVSAQEASAPFLVAVTLDE